MVKEVQRFLAINLFGEFGYKRRNILENIEDKVFLITVIRAAPQQSEFLKLSTMLFALRKLFSDSLEHILS